MRLYTCISIIECAAVKAAIPAFLFACVSGIRMHATLFDTYMVLKMVVRSVYFGVLDSICKLCKLESETLSKA
jgi:hypothetical protein